MGIVDVLAKIGFDWQMALANLVNFLIIFYILKRFAFAPIKKALDQRAQKIAQGLEDAKAAESERVMAKSNYEQKMQEARAEAQKIVAQAQEQSDAMVKKATTETEEKVASMLAEARALIAKEKDIMQRELEAKTVDIATMVAEKIIKKELNPETEKAVIAELVQKN